MNPDPTPNSPDDEARDPLLAALQQRLSNYGETPPPGAWAGIRQQLAVPRVVARPWWRQPRRALAMLLLLLLASLGLLVRQQRLLSGARRVDHAGLRHRPPTSSGPLAASADLPTAGRRPTVAPLPGAPLVKVPVAVAPQPPSRPAPARLRVARPLEALVDAGTMTRGQAKRTSFTPGLPTLFPQEAYQGQGRSAAAKREVSLLAQLRKKSSQRPKQRLARQETEAQATQLLLPSQVANHRGRRIRAAEQPVDSRQTNKPAGAASTPLQGAEAIVAQQTAKPEAAGSTRLLRAPLVLAGPEIEAVAPRAQRHRKRGLPFPQADLGAARFRPDSLRLRQVALVLAANPAHPLLTARPDSGRPASRPARRWALLLLAGPTLSYRTLGPSAADSAARAERPAAGLGAQLQLRRVLSGRWALAAGLGYQEYATRSVLHDSASSTVPFRNTYRLLTAPLQVGYVLGLPRGRWATNVLAGTEVGWYLGGRSTEESTCNCQQPTSTSGPYHSWSLAFSLSLDVHYRLGGSDSRWQWVLQPSGRYVITPFVRSGAVGFAARQPFSLGVLTGFSWDLH